MNHNFPCIIIMGPPGSGKSTLARLISRNKRFFPFDFGLVARKLKNDGKLDEEIVKCINQGIPLNPILNYNLVYSVINESLRQGNYDSNSQIIVSGGNFGTADNAIMLKTLLDIKHIFLLEASDATILKRIYKQAKEQKREDNDNNIINNRINNFRNNLSAILNEFDSFLVTKINAEQPIKKVLKEIKKTLDNLFENKLEIEVISDKNRWFSLKEVWNELMLKSRNASPSASFEWQWIWWKHYKPQSKLHILIVKNKNKIVGIMPLLYWNIQKYSFIPQCTADFLGFIAPNSYEKLLVFALEKGTDMKSVYELNHIPYYYHLFYLLKQTFSTSKNVEFKFDKIYKILINSTWEDYLKTRSKNFKKVLRKKTKKLKQFGSVEFIISKPVFDDMKDMIELHIKRYEGTSTPSKFLLDNRKGFLNDLINYKGLPFEIILFKLILNGTCVSYRLGFIMNEVYYDWNTSYDISFRNIISPGQILLMLIVKSFFEKKVNIKTFNFMRGDEDYKRHWSNDCDLNMRVFVK